VSKYNPKKHDYDQDGEVTYLDDKWGVKDYNQDGKVTDKEETRFNKERDETNTEYVYEGDKLVKTKVTGSGIDLPEDPEADISQYSDKFLKKHPEIKKLIDKAIEFGWTNDQFIKQVEQTAWGQANTAAEESFDLQITGADSEKYTDETTGLIPVKTRNIQSLLEAAGVTASAEEVAKFARNAVRSNYDDDTIRAWIASKYATPTQPETPPADGAPAAAATGLAGVITQGLRDMANSYGLPITPEYLEEKVRTGLDQADYRTWLEGQRAIFQQQAKLSYPTVADKFDSYTLTELMDPYLNSATQLLGVPRSEMKLTDPMWNSALKGDGGPMDLDQWVKTLRTDKKYGYTKTVAARQEASSLASGIIRAFGMS
jgi:hypothetical protein